MQAMRVAAGWIEKDRVARRVAETGWPGGTTKGRISRGSTVAKWLRAERTRAALTAMVDVWAPVWGVVVTFGCSTAQHPRVGDLVRRASGVCARSWRRWRVGSATPVEANPRLGLCVRAVRSARCAWPRAHPSRSSHVRLSARLLSARRGCAESALADGGLVGIYEFISLPQVRRRHVWRRACGDLHADEA